MNKSTTLCVATENKIIQNQYPTTNKTPHRPCGVDELSHIHETMRNCALGIICYDS